MKTLITKTHPVDENWNDHPHKFMKLFTWVTGYDIIFEGSRKDIAAEKSHKH